MYPRTRTSAPLAVAIAVALVVASGLPAAARAQTMGGFAAVSLGRLHACALRMDGAIACWGSNAYGQSSPPPGAFAAVSAGADFTCGLRPEGTIACWGWDVYHQAEPPAGTFTALDAGAVHACALRADGRAVCWGYDGFGQTNAPPGAFRTISAGSEHTCGLRLDGAVVCWGGDMYSQVSGCTRVFGPCIRDNPPGGPFRAVSAGGLHTCGIREDEAIECWGDMRAGQSLPLGGQAPIVSLGYGRWATAPFPPGTFAAISAGEWHSCVLYTAAGLTCWGSNGFGERVASDTRYLAVDAGDGVTCVVRTDRSLRCWGLAAYGLTRPPDGTPPTVTCSATPAELWPPNRKLVAIETHVDVIDEGSGPAGFTLVSVSGDGTDAGDLQGWEVGGADTAGLLRAEGPRTYRLVYRGADRAGNTALCTTTVTVPHDRRHAGAGP